MTIYDQMVAAYAQKQGTATPNVEQEVMQHIALAGLHRGGFFQHAAFYGGTCLRLFHNLPRYSEDMDFSLIEKRNDIHIENYFPSIIEEFRLAGHEVNIVKKDKKIFGRVESAFLKDNTEAYDIKFQTKKTVKVKIELDTDPPLAFETEQLVLQQPYSFTTRCFTLPDLYAMCVGTSPLTSSICRSASVSLVVKKSARKPLSVSFAINWLQRILSE